MKLMVKSAIILSACVVVLRILLEEVGAPGVVTNILSATALYLLVPIYFGLKISDAKPYPTLIKSVAAFAVANALFVWISYTLSYFLGFSSPRFAAVITPGSTAGQAITAPGGVFILIAPIAIIVGSLVGSLVLFIRGKMAK